MRACWATAFIASNAQFAVQVVEFFDRAVDFASDRLPGNTHGTRRIASEVSTNARYSFITSFLRAFLL